MVSLFLEYLPIYLLIGCCFTIFDCFFDGYKLRDPQFTNYLNIFFWVFNFAYIVGFAISLIVKIIQKKPLVSEDQKSEKVKNK